MRQRHLLFMICITVFALITLSGSIYDYVQADHVIIETDHLNVRSGPGMDYDIIHQVHTNEQYDIIDQIDGWVEIELDYGTGWVAEDYISIEQDEENTASESLNEITIPFDQIHIRSGPSTAEEIIDYADKNDTYEVIGQEDDWLQIALSDTETGYINQHVLNSFPDHTLSHYLKGKTIVIDPGHGGHDVGAIGANGTFEKDLTFITAIELQKSLETLGAHAVLTRQKDEFVSLSSRATVANTYHADVFISIHYNSFPDVPSVQGIDTYYYRDEDKVLAEQIQTSVVKNVQDQKRNVSYGNFQVLRQSHQPSVLVELGFISHEMTEQNLQTKSYHQKLVQGIIKGLATYFIIR